MLASVFGERALVDSWQDAMRSTSRPEVASPSRMHPTPIKAPGGSRGTPGMTTTQRAMLIRERPTTRCPRTSVRGFLSNVR